MEKEDVLKNNDTKETMIAALAHEIKNPLNTIKGANKFLQIKYNKNKEIYEFTEIIENEIIRLERYLNEFLSFSRGIKLKLKEIDPVSYIHGVVIMAKYGFKGSINIKCKNKKYPKILIDPELFRQVLDNLILNAKDAVKNKKEQRIDIILKHNEKYFFIAISDNGSGIPKQIRKKIFMPFFTTKANGMGIGLSICNAILKKHNCCISVKSKEKQGSTFIIKIPLKNKKEKLNDE